MTLQGKVALVTGAANGIGRGITERLLADGANIVALDVAAGALATLAEELGTSSERLEPVEADVSNRDDVRRAVARAVERFDGLDILCSNAGIADADPFLEISDASWRRIIDVNLTGAFHCIQEAARVMALKGKGAIVVTTSTNGFYVESNLAAYNASKGGVDALIRAAAIDLAWHGIRVNGIAPSMVKTRAAFITSDPVGSIEYLKRVPMGRFADPSEIAAAVAFLASDEASYVTGQTIILDGGLTLGIDMPLPQAPLPGSAKDGA
ncbi:MAG: SDR family oxidoreductase [Thermomicrobiales bacterium]|nr:SDR family oxidoreductase [Thermomicrobiales bacterium]